jgi:DNA-binding response OmpR family regulator
MVYGFVTQSGGTVALQSELGRGTVVSMYLPVAAASATPKAAAEAGSERGSERILLVEDEPHVRDLVVMQLSALGYTVEAQPDAQAAMAACQDGRYDLLLTDVILPGGINGRELADRLAGQRPKLRVLFTSGYSQRAIEIQGVLMPGATLLHKPFRKAELARKVRDVLGGPAYADIARGHWKAPASDAAE